MPDTMTLLTFAGVAFLLIVVPGPTVVFVVGRAFAHGRAVAVRSAAGNAAGQLVAVLAVSVGLGAVITEFAALFTAVKLLGAAYLVYLGVQAIRHRRAVADALDSGVPGRDGWRAVGDGFVVGVTNPKSLVFFMAALPQFADPALGNVPLQLFVFGALFVAIALVCDTSYALLAGSARNWFLRAPRRMEVAGAASGVVMIGLGAQFALTGRED